MLGVDLEIATLRPRISEPLHSVLAQASCHGRRTHNGFTCPIEGLAAAFSPAKPTLSPHPI